LGRGRVVKGVEMEDLRKFYKPPFNYDAECQCVLGSDNHLACEIRGWGELLSRGAKEPLQVQREMGELIAGLLNEHFSGNRQRLKDRLAELEPLEDFASHIPIHGPYLERLKKIQAEAERRRRRIDELEERDV